MQRSVFMLGVIIYFLFLIYSGRSEQDHYTVLGVSKDATAKEIKKSYHKLAAKYHPDKNKSEGASEEFRKVAEAYAVLSDENKRAEYDSGGKRDMFWGDSYYDNDFSLFNEFNQFSFFDSDLLKTWDNDDFSHNKYSRHMNMRTEKKQGRCRTTTTRSGNSVRTVTICD